MTDNDSVPKASNPSRAKPVPKNVAGTVTLNTRALDPNRSTLLDQATDLFKAQVQEIYGEKIELTNVTVTVDKHKVGEFVTYAVAAQTAA